MPNDFGKRLDKATDIFLWIITPVVLLLGIAFLITKDKIIMQFLEGFGFFYVTILAFRLGAFRKF